MRKTTLFSFGAGALLLTAVPFAGMAQGQDAGASRPEEAYDYRHYAGSGDGLPSFYALTDRLDDLRYYYTGKAIRFRLAGMLSAQETAIGIRADQQDAWRAYTNALLSLIPDRDAVLSVIGAPDEDPKGPEAFDRVEALSDALAAKAEKAQVLKRAITDLRAKLTPEQLEAARMPRLISG
ncbi:hypothetical protein [Agrobacterium sp. B1(2019)]|uniref:hypothetical protein n=1 Tax=Agrobacterium sp. B1(2019) TaxID=2607032 RepID=UPI0011ED4F7C|nr:hypothetical protein [Agrobacterium sp. B1(2019)]TZG33477.1 hypothetical protein AGR1_23670 [Agrobacterium sp. B1(2019)]